MVKKGKLFSTKNIAVLAVLLALVIVLQAVGGSISFGAVTLNFTLIPIVLGSMMLGCWAGALLGFASGVIVLIQVITAPSGFYYIIWTYSPFITTLICLLKTTVAGFLAGLFFKLIEEKNLLVGVFLASAIVPIVNTGLFILGCMAMWDTIALMADGVNVFKFIIVGLVTFNFFIELAINLIVAPALNIVYRAVEKQIGGRKK